MTEDKLIEQIANINIFIAKTEEYRKNQEENGKNQKNLLEEVKIIQKECLDKINSLPCPQNILKIECIENKVYKEIPEAINKVWMAFSGILIAGVVLGLWVKSMFAK